MHISDMGQFWKSRWKQTPTEEQVTGNESGCSLLTFLLNLRFQSFGTHNPWKEIIWTWTLEVNKIWILVADCKIPKKTKQRKKHFWAMQNRTCAQTSLPLLYCAGNWFEWNSDRRNGRVRGCRVALGLVIDDRAGMGRVGKITRFIGECRCVSMISRITQNEGMNEWIRFLDPSRVICLRKPLFRRQLGKLGGEEKRGRKKKGNTGRK